MQSTTNRGKPTPKTVDEALEHARRSLNNRLEADLLARRALGCERSWLYAHGGDPIDAEALARLERLVAARLDGRPIAQLFGGREFYGREFHIDERVLIPRPETELLVDLALALPLPADARVCDVGTGSGCIALTLAAERPEWRVTGIDRSSEALDVAARNRDRLGLGRVELLEGDLLAPVAGHRFDLIVSNPPYVAEADPHLDRGDLRFEPRQALTGGPDGLDIVRRLISAGRESLAASGWLVIEHGHDQARQVRALLEKAGFSSVATHEDLAGIERATLGRKGETTR